MNTVPDTLDVCLFSGAPVWPSKLIEWALGTAYSHVALGLRNPTYIDESLVGTFIVESGEEVRPSAVGGKIVWGVQMQDWQWIVESYEGRVYMRKLRWISRPDNLAESIEAAWNRAKGAKYDDNIVDLLRADFGWALRGDCRKTTEFVCSAFAAYVLCCVGALPRDIKWDTLNPGDYAENGRIDALLRQQGVAKLESVVQLK